MTLIKRVFGLITLATGATLLVFALGQKVIAPNRPFQWRPLFGGIVWGAISWKYGRKWLFNWITLDVMPVDPGDPAIALATQRARGTLNTLWGYLDQHRYQCYIKFPMQTKDGTFEHIWSIVHAREGDQLVVSLANEPVDEPNAPDARRTVSVSEIEDWQVMVSPTEVRGGYSIGALAEIAQARGYSISPSDRKMLAAFVDVWKTGTTRLEPL